MGMPLAPVQRVPACRVVLLPLLPHLVLPRTRERTAGSVCRRKPALLLEPWPPETLRATGEREPTHYKEGTAGTHRGTRRGRRRRGGGAGARVTGPKHWEGRGLQENHNEEHQTTTTLASHTRLAGSRSTKWTRLSFIPNIQQLVFLFNISQFTAS